ncbi:MAG TPA: GTP-binding protein [Methanothermococcus okinawensis]|uniref:GTP-binding protein n=1 Tax=Methanothermococcus okinawensis TaxID=155863 RepID=A0A832YU24_9EURY|nr:GTP-binding protein [Methanothermococcus okinawensis]
MEKIKVVILGSEDVGKTTLMENLLGNIGKVEYNKTTVAIDYGSLILNGKKIHIFGTPGQKRFHFMRELTLKGVDFAIVVLDSSKGIMDLDKKIINTLNNMNIPYLIFLNKIDIVNRENLNKLLYEIKENYKDCCHIIEGSGLNGVGLDKLKDILSNLTYRK